MKYADIEKLSIDELQEKVVEVKRQLASLKFDNAIAPLQNPMQVRNLKKDIARMLTAITAKQNAASNNK